MSFESKMKKRGNKKIDKFAKNPYSVSWIKRVPLWTKIVVPATLMAVGAALVITISLPKTQSKNSIKIGDSNSVVTSTPGGISLSGVESQHNSYPQSQAYSNCSSVYTPEDWEKRSINDKYRLITYNNINYYSYLYPSVEEQYIGELLDNAIARGDEVKYEDYNAVTITHETNVSLYRINGFDPSFVLAANFDEDDGYYWYKNITDINPYQTMDAFLSKVDLNQVAYFPYAFYDCEENDKRARYQYNDINEALVTSCFFSNPDAVFCKEFELPNGDIKYYSQYTNYISIPIYMPRLHLATSSNGASGFSVYDNGFLELTFLNKKDLFYIGEEAYQTFKDYLSNLTGELLPNYYPN